MKKKATIKSSICASDSRKKEKVCGETPKDDKTALAQTVSRLHQVFHALPETKAIERRIKAAKKLSSAHWEKLPEVTEEEAWRPPTDHPTRTDYNLEYIPCDGPTRRARREMLRKFFLRSDSKIFQVKADSYTAEEFRRQERADEAGLAGIRAACGRSANWRDALIFEAKRKKADLDELEWLLAHAAITGDHNELNAFAKASRHVAKAHSKLINESRMFAVMYGIRSEIEHGKLPTRAETVKAIQSAGINIPASNIYKYDNNANRIFSGPYLSRFPRAKPWSVS